jgi:hypothetical protein
VKPGTLTLAAVFIGTTAWAGDPDYQRYDLVREASELTLEALFHYWTQETGTHDLHSLRFGAMAEYIFLSLP